MDTVANPGGKIHLPLVLDSSDKLSFLKLIELISYTLVIFTF